MNSKKWGFSFALSIAVFTGAHATAHASTDDVMVMYKNEAGKKLATQQASEIDENLENMQAVTGTYSKEALKSLAASKNIEVVHTNDVKLQASDTSVSLYPDFLTRKVLWNMDMINVKEAWKLGYFGSGIKIGIIDSEIVNRSELSIKESKSFLSDEGEPDTAEHGTFVAGIINAKSTATSDVVGIAPASELYSLNVLNKDGASINDIISALDYAIDKKLDILNISLGIKEEDLLEEGESLADNPLTIAIKKAQDAGIIIVAASGNNGTSVELPAAYDNVIAVGSVDSSKNRSTFSNAGKEVTVVAPGTNIESLDYTGGTKFKSGTSFATPHIVAMIALLENQFPKVTNTQIIDYLKEMAVPLSSENSPLSYGSGLIYYPMSGVFQSTVVKPTPTPVVVKPTPKPAVVVKTLTDEEKYVKANKTKIATIIKKMTNKKTINYKTEFGPIYTVYNALTTKQKATVQAYRKKQGITVISATASSTRVKATNLKTINTKKTSTVTFSSTMKLSTLKPTYFSFNKAGKLNTNFTVTKTSSGKKMTIKSKKTLAKGTYYLYIDTTNFRTTKNKKVKPFVIKYTVK